MKDLAIKKLTLDGIPQKLNVINKKFQLTSNLARSVKLLYF